MDGSQPMTSDQVEGRPLEVLIVDDSHGQRRLLAMALRRLDIAVSEASSATQALKMCLEIRFDLLRLRQ